MLKKIIAWLGWGMLVLIIAVSASVWFLSKQGWQFYAVLSGSMEPIYHVGGLVIIKPVSALDLNVGDAIAFKYPTMNTPVCHRIVSIEITKDGLVFHTKGDANNVADEQAVTADMVKGRAIGHVSYVGRLTELIGIGSKPMNLLGRSVPAGVLAIFGMGGLFIVLTLKDTFDYIQHPERARQKELFKRRDAQRLKRKKIFGLA
jgi:signal peptidase